MEAPDEDAIKGRTMSVKIDNHPQAQQIGINAADVVFEFLAEGGITRFHAIFQSDLPEAVMPVRSARDTDIHIVEQFGDPLFFYSGGNANVLRKVRAAGVTSMDHGSIGSALYQRSSAARAPHNLVVDLAKAYEVATDKGFEITTPEPIKGLAFQSLVFDNPDYSSVEETVTSTTVNFAGGSSVQWDWNDTDHLWERSVRGRAKIDGATDAQISTNNLIVMWARHGAGSQAPRGVSTLDIDVTSGGDAAIFMNGKRIDGTWVGSADAPPVFKDKEGREIELMPGRTFISIVDVGETITSTNAGADAE